jgi:hypothetical protein
MVLCKAMQRGTSQPEVPPEQNPNFSDCPVCLGFAFGKSVLFSPLATNPVPQGLPLVFTFNTNDEADNGRGTSRTHARAPPLSA